MRKCVFTFTKNHFNWSLSNRDTSDIWRNKNKLAREAAQSPGKRSCKNDSRDSFHRALLSDHDSDPFRYVDVRPL